jgi:hypothetical protein
MLGNMCNTVSTSTYLLRIGNGLLYGVIWRPRADADSQTLS